MVKREWKGFDPGASGSIARPITHSEAETASHDVFVHDVLPIFLPDIS